MNVYTVSFDGDFEVVEAESFGHAIQIWRLNLLREWKESGDYKPTDDDVEPEQVSLLIEGRSVLREARRDA